MMKSDRAEAVKRTLLPTDERHHMYEEAAGMLLYTSVVLLATLFALPNRYDLDGAGHGFDHNESVLAVVWGATVGLVLAHWFARAIAMSTTIRHRFHGPLAEGIGAVVPAIWVSVLILVVSDSRDVDGAILSLTLLLGASGVLVPYRAGRRRAFCLGAGAACLVLGVAIALVKQHLGGH